LRCPTFVTAGILGLALELSVARMAFRGTEPEPSSSENQPDRNAEEGRRRRLPHLSLGTRVLSFAVGWSLVLVGVAGLALPGIQGVLTILFGVAVLSVASESAYRLLRRLFHRWPSIWRRIDSVRSRVHDRLHRKR
jgi:hypothetical protein